MTPMVEFVDAIIAYEESYGRNVESVRLGVALFADLKRETTPRLRVVHTDERSADMTVRGVRVWCDPTMPEDAGEAITVK